ncbi:MAG: (4Fe-4S)-binding protein [Candidatus Fimadaptatus sp.]
MATLTISPAEEKRVKALGFLSNKGTDNFSGRVITVNGKVTAEQMACVAEAARLFGNGIVTMTTRLTFEVQGIPFDRIEDFRAYIARAGLVTGGTGAKVRPVVSCKGTTCRFGLIDTFGLSEKVHHRFFEGYGDVKLPHKFKIAVGGCPNNCVKPDLNDVGIVGQRIPVFEEEKCRGCKKCGVIAECPMHAASIVEDRLLRDEAVCNNCGRCIDKCYFGAMNGGKTAYKVYIGGRWGKQTASGRALSRLMMSEEEALDMVEKCLLLFKKMGQPGERFANTIDRLGFDKVEEMLYSDELLNEKEVILKCGE